jgi:hypothetical protein
LVKNVYTSDDSILRIVEFDVKPIKRVKYLTKGIKYITNHPAEKQSQYQQHSVAVPFQIESDLRAGHATATLMRTNQVNCSQRFEQLLINTAATSRQGKAAVAAQQQIDALTPFKCSASLYTKSGRRLAYLDRLLGTSVTYADQHWSCEIAFAADSSALIYSLLENNVDRGSKKSGEAFSDENEPTLIKLAVVAKATDVYDEPADEEATGLLPFVPTFHVQTRQIELPIVRSSVRKEKEAAASGTTADGDHFNLVIQTTHQIQSHLVLTSNCPSLVKINPLLTGSGGDNSNSPLFTVSYDIVTSDEMFDLTTYSNLMQQHQGQLYVQVSCSLTQQIERIPIKFLFGLGDMSHVLDYKPSHHQQRSSSLMYNLVGWFFDYSPNQITSFLVAVSLFLITVLCLLRIRSPVYPTVAEQRAINALQNSFRAGGGGGVKDHSSFNPYRYFTAAADTSRNDFAMRQRNASGGASPLAGGNRLSPQKQQDASFNNRSVYASPNQNMIDRSQVRLFSTDANVSPATVHYHDGSFSRVNKSGYRSFHGNDSYGED